MEIITFKDLQGAEQSVDLDGKFNVAFNCDCETIMQAMPDKCVDLLCADPPYGDGSSQSVNVERERETQPRWNRFGQRFDRYKHPPGGSDSTEAGRRTRGRSTSSQTATWDRFAGGTTFKRYQQYPPPEFPEPTKSVERTGGTWAEKYGKKIIAWDVAPGKEVFDELFRVSRNSVIWGGNYFDLPPTRCFLVWRKLSISESFSMAMAEYAWTSFNANAKVFECAPQGKASDPRFHPTQKPIELYRWVFNLFCKPGDIVFDPYLGSGASRIAAYDAGMNFIGCEIDPVYFAKEEERFTKHTEQISLWE